MKIPQKPPIWQEIIKKNNSLLDIIENKETMELITTLNKKYCHWEKIRRQKIPKNTTHENIWAIIKMLRMSNVESLNFNDLKLKFSMPNETLKKLHELDKQSTRNLISDTTLILSQQDQKKYIISSLMEEAIASSQLEGAATTRRIAKTMLKNNRKPKTYSEQMILNGYNTLKLVVNKKKEKLTPEFLLLLQDSITKNTLKNKKNEGEFRDNNEVVVADPIELEKIYHHPPDFKEIPKLVKELCDFANDDSNFIHPIIKGIIIHFLIGYIHPFNNGNGRTARTVFYWYVLSRDYWLFEYTSISRKILQSKTQYGLAYLYTETDEFDLTYFINYNMKIICKSIDDTNEYIKRKQKEQKESYKLISKTKNISLRQASILKEMIKEPNILMTINNVKESYNIVYQTARTDLLDLTNKGFISKKFAKNKLIFFFDENNKTNLEKLLNEEDLK